MSTKEESCQALIVADEDAGEKTNCSSRGQRATEEDVVALGEKPGQGCCSPEQKEEEAADGEQASSTAEIESKKAIPTRFLQLTNLAGDVWVFPFQEEEESFSVGEAKELVAADAKLGPLRSKVVYKNVSEKVLLRPRCDRSSSGSDELGDVVDRRAGCNSCVYDVLGSSDTYTASDMIGGGILFPPQVMSLRHPVTGEELDDDDDLNALDLQATFVFKSKKVWETETLKEEYWRMASMIASLYDWVRFLVPQVLNPNPLPLDERCPRVCSCLADINEMCAGLPEEIKKKVRALKLNKEGKKDITDDFWEIKLWMMFSERARHFLDEESEKDFYEEDQQLLAGYLFCMHIDDDEDERFLTGIITGTSWVRAMLEHESTRRRDLPKRLLVLGNLRRKLAMILEIGYARLTSIAQIFDACMILRLFDLCIASFLDLAPSSNNLATSSTATKNDETTVEKIEGDYRTEDGPPSSMSRNIALPADEQSKDFLRRQLLEVMEEYFEVEDFFVSEDFGLEDVDSENDSQEDWSPVIKQSEQNSIGASASLLRQGEQESTERALTDEKQNEASHSADDQEKEPKKRKLDCSLQVEDPQLLQQHNQPQEESSRNEGQDGEPQEVSNEDLVKGASGTRNEDTHCQQVEASSGSNEECQQEASSGSNEEDTLVVTNKKIRMDLPYIPRIDLLSQQPSLVSDVANRREFLKKWITFARDDLMICPKHLAEGKMNLVEREDIRALSFGIPKEELKSLLGGGL
ncbi:unnamed protein product [Amoebophrya sp. A25]|nr:unnamed protein product [Amoebophrya sp. A25]|eukprot:GSA25T00002623001.1